MKEPTYSATWDDTGRPIYTRRPSAQATEGVPTSGLFGGLPLGTALLSRNTVGSDPWNGAKLQSKSGRTLTVRLDKRDPSGVQRERQEEARCKRFGHPYTVGGISRSTRHCPNEYEVAGDKLEERGRLRLAARMFRLAAGVSLGTAGRAGTTRTRIVSTPKRPGGKSATPAKRNPPSWQPERS